MEQIAIISDIHGNMPAYDAVLEDIQRRGIRRIFCLGDLVGKGPHSERAVDRTREVCDIVIRGNWDDFIVKPQTSPELQWHQNRLGEERMKYLSELPFCYDYWMSGRRVRLFHASPQSVYCRIQPWDSWEDRLTMFDNTDSTPSSCYVEGPDVAGYGDIHQAYMQHMDGKTLFNTGSVGNPLDMTSASYVIMEGEYKCREAAPFTIQFARVSYDIELSIQLAKDERMPLLEPYAAELRTAVYRGLQSKSKREGEQG
ncbi:metallophosphoesterase family protein [Marinicrinis lubricantis]|uniref:Metallophosphoesterase family protein n=1 Tax=Marinicrinis lubricantis TaxID=2086470 RepID=A0ABW1IL58_9BACL